MKQVDDYSSVCDSVDKQLTIFIDTAKGLNKEKLLPMNSVKLIGTSGESILCSFVFYLVANRIDSHLVKVSKGKKEKAIAERDRFWSTCSNLRPLSESLELIDVYKMNRNSQVQLLCSDEAAYVKYGNET